MIGSVFGPGSFASGRAAPAAPSARLIGGAGAALQDLAHRRDGLDAVTAALTDLREALTAARETASPVPGRSTRVPVVAEIAQTADRPTFVTVDGETVPDGVVTVSLGTRPLVVGYARTPRAPLHTHPALSILAGAGGGGRVAREVRALLRSAELATAINRPDRGAIDAAIARIDTVLAGAHGARAALDVHASAAAQVNLGALLLGAAFADISGTGGAGADAGPGAGADAGPGAGGYAVPGGGAAAYTAGAGGGAGGGLVSLSV